METRYGSTLIELSYNVIHGGPNDQEFPVSVDWEVDPGQEVIYGSNDVAQPGWPAQLLVNHVEMILPGDERRIVTHLLTQKSEQKIIELIMEMEGGIEDGRY